MEYDDLQAQFVLDLSRRLLGRWLSSDSSPNDAEALTLRAIKQAQAAYGILEEKLGLMRVTVAAPSGAVLDGRPVEQAEYWDETGADE